MNLPMHSRRRVSAPCARPGRFYCSSDGSERSGLIQGLTISFSAWQCGGHAMGTRRHRLAPLICARSRCVRPGARRNTGAGTLWWRLLPAYHGDRTSWALPIGGAGLAPCRDLGFDLACTHWLAAGRVQAGRARPGSAGARSSSRPARTQRRLHLIANNARFVVLTTAPGAQSGLAGAGTAVRRAASNETFAGHCQYESTMHSRRRVSAPCARPGRWLLFVRRV